ncbi:MAG: hypothetical protein KIT71_09355 [Nitrospira sp.]|nr:hypothetical protein [Nitrospira sp.]MCW5779682.1 hypothetical protein [Nitrospira sp.]
MSVPTGEPPVDRCSLSIETKASEEVRGLQVWFPRVKSPGRAESVKTPVRAAPVPGRFRDDLVSMMWVRGQVEGVPSQPVARAESVWRCQRPRAGQTELRGRRECAPIPPWWLYVYLNPGE